MGKPKEKQKEMTTIDELRWYEVLTCCCKWRGECNSCVMVTLVYVIPIITLVLLGGACLAIGVIFRDACSDKFYFLYWLRGCSGTWLLELMIYCVKAIKDGYYGITCWRILASIEFVMFSAWMVIGTLWVTDAYTCSTCCSSFLRHFALSMLVVHWNIWILALIAQIYIASQVLCCCADNAIRPLKGNLDKYDDELNI